MPSCTRLGRLLAVIAVTACGGARAPADSTVKSARIALPDPVVTCEEWVRRAVADPDEVAGCKVPRNSNWAAVQGAARGGGEGHDAGGHRQ